MNNMPTSKKIAIVLLSVITVILAAVAVIVGIRLQQGQAPVDTSAIDSSSSTISEESSISSEESSSSESSLSSSSTSSLSSSSSSNLSSSRSSSTSSITSSAQKLDLVESSTVTSLTNGGATIAFTILVSNNNSSTTNLDFVYDDLPSGLTSSQVSGLTPSTADITDNRITWTVNDGISPNTSSTFSYILTLTKSQITTLVAQGGYKDMVTAQYDEGSQLNNTITFNLTTALSILPDTGLFDTPYGVIAVGIILILMGLLVNRYGLLLRPLGVGKASSQNGSSNTMQRLLEKVGIDLSSDTEEEKFERKVMRDRDTR